MPASLQTIIAIVIVVIAATLLVRSWLKKGKHPGCSSEGCGAISPEVKKLQARLAKR
jgi:ABC-type cobalt transport system substrate-binding protein